MSETKNYKLHITDDSNERFQDWRNAMNGPNDSNIIKIDRVLGEKQDKITGKHGQIIGFDETGTPVAQEAAETGSGKNSVSVNGGGEITLPTSFGDGPYIFEMTEELDTVAEGGVGIPSGGTTGQILSKMSDSDYDAQWVDAPSGGSEETVVASFNGRSGAVVPKIGDYTADMVGARPDSWTPTAAEVGARPDTWFPSADDIGARPDTWMPSAEDVGAATLEQVNTAIQSAILDSWEGSY